MTFASGESNDMLMDKARAIFKRENKKKLMDKGEPQKLNLQ